MQFEELGNMAGNGHVVNTNSGGEMKDYEREKEKCYCTAV